MLKFLTHKLRTHSINEDNSPQKTEEDHDSGTESDDDIETASGVGTGTSARIDSVSPADTGCSMESPAPDQHDPHSSEEELEVINNSKQARSRRPPRAASVSLPEKRKWSQVNDGYSHRHRSSVNDENSPHTSNLSPSLLCSPHCKHCLSDDTIHLEHSGSSDDEVHHLLASMATPVRFRTSPPLEAVKPGGRAVGNGQLRSLSPPAKLVHYEVSPRKRSRHTRHTTLQRPCLDFEKMQQLKTYSVTPWRNSNDHGGELSVFCW